MANYRLLALDLDGTLLTEDKKITAEAREWIHRATDAGVTVIFATGRGVQTTKAFWEELRLETPMVLLNGAEIWRKPGQLEERRYLSRDEIRKLHSLAVEADAGYWGYSVESLTGRKDWTDDMFERDWMKFGMRHDDLDVIDRLRKTVRSWGTLEVTCSAPINMEISCKGISKESGVRHVCQMLGIGMEEVMAVGDNMNDFRLIQSAGLGIAMGNADEKLKQAADGVTSTNEENGVAQAIQRYLLGDGHERLYA
ncbi:Cof-type HAD-IIB family hydrolase [Paenibacillus sp. J2TS4]|uniref:Cof-type HAD-IIB family hydrolase n=1 Tax=Paenibacillus sp. J2TS4 TaxID=2807194 RepID=UPI001B25747D|nr:Cof-type HAD-IIB family hydrolase [Paenibacillus sp. J2TS4]GIP35394.1 5-amino-6-(5-phospho-D-ribitylamino)uracil phosphatase YcsE [Paenibacillus sp. J2TS4]